MAGATRVRDRPAVRRGRGGHSVDQPNVDGDLQNLDRHQSPLCPCLEPTPRRGRVDHTHGGDHDEGGPGGRAAGRCRELDADRHARGHTGADEEPTGGRYSGYRRYGSGAGGLLCRQAGLRGRPGQCTGVYRTHGEPAESGGRHYRRQDIRQRGPLFSGELRRRRPQRRRRRSPRVHPARRLFPLSL